MVKTRDPLYRTTETKFTTEGGKHSLMQMSGKQHCPILYDIPPQITRVFALN